MVRLALLVLALWLPALDAGPAARQGALKVGDQAPTFSLAGSDGRTYSLSDYAGRQVVVLAWFAKAFTSG